MEFRPQRVKKWNFHNLTILGTRLAHDHFDLSEDPVQVDAILSLTENSFFVREELCACAP